MQTMTTNNKGFTLVELLVALAVSSIAMTAIYSTYMTQQKSFSVQQDVATMQSNLRAAMYLLSSELRMAGYDPTGKAGAGITTATKYTNSSSQALIRFTADENGDGDVADVGEDITYEVYTDSGIQRLVRVDVNDSTTKVPVAEYIDRFHLYFLDENNAQTTDTAEMRSIQVTLVAATSKKDNDYKDTFTYQDLQASSDPFTADGYRRLALSSQIRCRNLGL